MREVMLLAEEMKDELKGAKKYAKCYLKYKDSEPITAKRYYEMANDEIKHATYLHDIAVDKINELKAQGVEYPDWMEVIWDEKHDEYIDKMAKVKDMLMM